jgi:hypothetical protein
MNNPEMRITLNVKYGDKTITDTSVIDTTPNFVYASAVINALKSPPAVQQEPASSNVQAKWLGGALFDCIKASGIIREDIGNLSVGELLFFSKDLKGMLERQAATPPAAAQPEMRRAGIVVPMLGTMRTVQWDDGMIPSAGSILWTKDE